MKFGLVSHDSFAYKGSLIVHGGSTGGDFNREFAILSGGNLTYA